MSKIRRAARELLKLEEKDPKRLFEGNALIRYVWPFHIDALHNGTLTQTGLVSATHRRLVRIGVLDESRMRLDYVLALKV